MRVVLVFPTRTDPAHRRVAAALAREYSRAGDEALVFAPTGARAPAALLGRLERLLGRAKADVCHVQFFSRGLGYLAGLRVPSRTRLIVTHQGASLDFLEQGRAFDLLCGQADAVTAVSRSGLRDLRSRFETSKSPFRWIPNGTDIASLPRTRAVRRHPFILSVGRLASYKGSDLLLMAFASVADEYPALELKICGPDQTRGRLARFARRLGLGKRVHFLGDVSSGRVRRLLDECLFFALPSRRENMPMALLEAMAAGKAVVASALETHKELIAPGTHGLLFAPGDVAQLARAMRRLASDAGLRRRLGRQAALRARRFQWRAVAAQYRRLYADAIASDRLPCDRA